MARRLISRRKLNEALDLLNDTIRQDPRFAESFENRAEVFEMLGMYPQAQADRRKAGELRVLYPPPLQPTPPPTEEPAPPASATPPAPDEAQVIVGSPFAPDEPADESTVEPDLQEELPVVEEPLEDVFAPEPAPDRYDSPPMTPAYRGAEERSVGAAFLQAAAVVFFALGIFIVAGVGIYVALGELQGDDNPGVPSATSPGATDPSASAGASPSDTSTRVPGSLEEALAGSPFPFTRLQAAWEGKDLTVDIGEISTAVTNFDVDAVDVTLSRGGATMSISVLLYGSQDGPAADWNLGGTPSPKEPGRIPADTSIWYNLNAVVVVTQHSEAIKPDALAAFLDLAS
ncbi:MAG: hypothetical protein WD904_14225 [Dehalococcoidia bacterium]